MSAAQSAVSFICAAILAMFLAARRVREDVAKLALVAWLLGCNFVHGINAAAWSSNVDLKGLVWCDIVTRLVLATTIAIPGACLCISRYLETVSSSRHLPSGAKALRNRRLFDALVCYFIPLIYLPLHVVGQNNRFDLIKGIGCMAAVHPSTPASMIVWMPHIIVCIASITYSGLAIHRGFRHPTTHFSVHLESRASMTTSVWTRTLAISMTVSGVTLLVLIFSMFSLPMSDSWLSWQHVHEHLTKVSIVGDNNRILGIMTFWWGLRVITFCYIALAFALGEETRDMAKYLASVKIKKPSFSLRPLITSRRRKDDIDFFPSSSLSRPTRPVTLELKSGWDDDLNIKSSSRLSPKSWKMGRPPPASPSPSSRSNRDAAEETFMKSTLSYLGSPLGNSLGYNAPVLPPPIYKKKSKTYVDSSVVSGSYLPVTSPTSPTRPLLPKQSRSRAESKASNITTVLQELWPAPPVSIPSPVPSAFSATFESSIEGEISPTRASSPALSIDERRQACSYFPSASPPRMNHDPPFGGSVRSLSPPPGQESVSSGSSRTRRPSIKSLRNALSGEKLGHKRTGSNEVIHMTVVQETV
ncbi:STE3-domain-containing protein [Macrolepiota fuliginosa MF-IS2]|uniref:STE3-domain-containing protein n=1 Tax=Macrolepiota fuliginosa MF-IS2 TaxID=1400762 RepID=A0A9P5XAV4_9AGAR|nr:STE3-domain-containing protein [Macrolepiota fuliginosa MF-IS2]